MKKCRFILIPLVLLLLLAGCSLKSTSATDASDTVVLNIAYQYGLAYAPLIVCKENNLIEKAYKEATGNDLTIVWNQLSSGAEINTGFASNSIDVGFMGIAPAITGISKNVGYKIFTGLSGQEHGMMTNNPQINSLEDLIGSNEQIALVNIGSIQHIILAKALLENGYDPHTLDSNLVALKHPDGMNAINSGNVSCHLTSNPYIYLERENESLHELSEIANSWNVESSFIVGLASTSLYENNPTLYKALCDALAASIKTITDDYASVATLTSKYNGNSYEDELTFLQLGAYTASTSGIYELSQFMYEYGFIDNKIVSYSDLVFENVIGD